MEWNQILAIIGVNVALFAALATLIVWVVNKVDSDVKSIGDRIDKMGSRLDSHALRIDQSYKMFVDLQKSMDQKFYDLLKDRKHRTDP